MNDELEPTPEESPEESVELTSEEPTKLQNTFRNPFGHLRAGWRMLIHWLIILAIAGPTNFFLHSIRNSIPGGKGIHAPRIIVLYIGIVIAFSIAAYLTLKYVDKRPFRTLGFWFSPGWFKEYAIGLGFGFGPLTVIFFILWGADLLDVSKGVWDITLLFFLLKMLLLFALAGTFEELMLRGYFFQALIEGSNKWIAAIVFSLIFSVLHMANPNWSAMGALFIFLSGLELAVAYIKTRSLWLPIGMHMAWNWSQGPLWGMNVSGTTMETSVLVSVPQGPEFWSGGEFGAEGSAIAVIVSLLTIWIIWNAKWIKPSEANIALWKKYPASYGVPPEESEM